MAQREIALSLGEPPATKGYPPSAFGMIPKLVESAGNSESAGSMTAIYTVLAEGDDQQDPIVDCARGAGRAYRINPQTGGSGALSGH